MSNQPVTFGKRNAHLAQPSNYGRAAAPASEIRTSRVAAGISAPVTYASLSAQSPIESEGETSRFSATETEMMRFIGANWPKYRDMWHDMKTAPGYKVGFSVVAFFFPIPWLFYRKLYAVAFGAMGASFLIPFIAPSSGNYVGLGISCAMATVGKSLVVKNAMTKIAQIKTMGLSPDATALKIEKAGGSNMVGSVIISIVLFIAVMVAIGAGVTKAVKSAAPPAPITQTVK